MRVVRRNPTNERLVRCAHVRAGGHRRGGAKYTSGTQGMSHER
jgi:hypothetical protein